MPPLKPNDAHRLRRELWVWLSAVGGYAPLARKLRVPARWLRRFLNDETTGTVERAQAIYERTKLLKQERWTWYQRLGFTRPLYPERRRKTKQQLRTARKKAREAFINGPPMPEEARRDR